jgi:hypothetical protein
VSRIPVSRKDRVRSEAKKRRVADQNLSTQALSPTDVNALIAQYLIDNPVGGSSVGKIVAFESGSIPPSSSGVLLTRTALPDQYFKITSLTASSSVTEAGVTLTINGVDVFLNKDLADATPFATPTTNAFGVSQNYGPPNTLGINVLKEIYCTSFTLTKVVGTTVQTVYYAYETLEAL